MLVTPKHEKLERLVEKADALASRCQELLTLVEEAENLLVVISTPGWDKLVDSVLVPKMNRIAHRNIKIDVDDRENRLRAEGAYDAIKGLAEKKETVQRDIDDYRRELSAAQDRLFATNNQVTKLQE